MRMNASHTLVMLLGAALIASGGLMTLTWLTGSTALRGLVSQLLLTPAFSWSAGLTYLAAGIILAAISRRRMGGGGRGVDILIAAMAALALLGSVLSLSGFSISINPLGIPRLPVSPTAGPLPVPPAVIGLLVGLIGFLTLHRPRERLTLLIGGLLLSALSIFFLAAAGFDGKSMLLLLLGLGMLLLGSEEQVTVPAA